MKRASLGLLGGSFDPIHFGHLFTARYLREDLELDRVVFIPSTCPPHKQNRSLGAEGDGLGRNPVRYVFSAGSPATGTGALGPGKILKKSTGLLSHSSIKKSG